jgi:glycosyltransferase involved in cell wall biosynthesis
MNICMISPYPPQTGGVPVHTEGLVKRLSKKHKVFLITYGGLGRKSSKNVEIIEVPVINVKFLRGLSFFLGALFRLRSVLKNNKIDIIHSQFMHPPGSVASFYRKLGGGRKAKFIVTAHGSDLLSLGRGRLGRWLVRRVGNSCDALVCVSGYLAKTAESLGIGKRKLKVILNGLDDRGLPREGGERLREALRLPRDRKIVTFAGTLTEAKGADIFLLLAEHLQHRRRDVLFVLVGKGPEMKSLREFSERAGLSGSVLFAGPKSHADTLGYIKASDAVVVPSRIEGFGLTALEAARLRVPVVASGAGALSEVMSNRSVTDNIPHTVLKVLDSKKFRDALVSENYKISRRFTLERMCDETERLYRKRP